MEITHRRLPRVDVLSVSGRVQAPEAATLKEHIDQLFNEGRYRLVLDLERLDYISSGGLRVLIDARKRAREHKLGGSERGDVRIVHLPPQVKNVFDLTGVTSLFQIYDDLLEAVGSY